MLNLDWTWLEAAVMAAVFLSAQPAAARMRRAHRAVPFLREAGLVCGLYALWQFAATLSQSGTYAAVTRGAWIWDVERTLHVPGEQTVQGWVLPHPLIVQAANLYYDIMHFTAMFAVLIWLFLRHRDLYPRWRTTVALFTAQCLLIQLVPVAPPRMVPSTGMVDTAVRYGQSVYNSSGGFQADALSAMPSVHIGWALLVAMCLLRVAPGPWRYIGVVHATATIFAVVATGNHYWADGFVAALLIVGTIAAQALVRRLWAAPARLPAARDGTDATGQVQDAAPVDGIPHVNGQSRVHGIVAGKDTESPAPVRQERE
jgi:hypothetical protein